MRHGERLERAVAGDVDRRQEPLWIVVVGVVIEHQLTDDGLDPPIKSEAFVVGVVDVDLVSLVSHCLLLPRRCLIRRYNSFSQVLDLGPKSLVGDTFNGKFSFEARNFFACSIQLTSEAVTFAMSV